MCVHSGDASMVENVLTNQSYQDKLNAQLAKNTQQTYNNQLDVATTPNALFIIQYANNTTSKK